MTAVPPLPVPSGTRLAADPSLRAVGDGRVLIGGMPVTLMRLGPRAARLVDEWLRGAPVPDDRAAGLLARRLLETGMAHPVPEASDVRDLGSSDGHLRVPDVRAPDLTVPHPTVPHPTVPHLTVAAVTVVIPVRDRRDQLARCLAALGHPAPRPAAVLVVDDGSADPAAIAAVAAEAGAHVLRHAANRGPAAARNTGLAAATTPLVAFLDSDCVPSVGWLTVLVAHLADPAVAAAAPRIVAHARAGAGVGGREVGPPGATARTGGWLTAYETGHSALDLGTRPGIVRPRAVVPYVPSAALLVRADAAGEGFDESLRVGEDVDFVWRLAERGWQVRYEPTVFVAHEHRVGFGAWFARRVAYGTSAAPLELRHPGTLPAVSMPGWAATAWAAAALGPPVLGPVAGACVAAGATVVSGRRLGTWMRRPWPTAVSLTGRGTLTAGELLARTVTRTWWPIALPLAATVRRARLPLAAAVLVPPALAWHRAREKNATTGRTVMPPRAAVSLKTGTPLKTGAPLKTGGGRQAAGAVGFVYARVLDDLAYSVGVWAGCARHRTLAPLRAHLTWRGIPRGRPPSGRRGNGRTDGQGGER